MIHNNSEIDQKRRNLGLLKTKQKTLRSRYIYRNLIVSHCGIIQSSSIQFSMLLLPRVQKSTRGLGPGAEIIHTHFHGNTFAHCTNVKQTRHESVRDTRRLDTLCTTSWGDDNGDGDDDDDDGDDDDDDDD